LDRNILKIGLTGLFVTEVLNPVNPEKSCLCC
jgi:hypothetical protein